jgi:hypothetical protein
LSTLARGRTEIVPSDTIFDHAPTTFVSSFPSRPTTLFPLCQVFIVDVGLQFFLHYETATEFGTLMEVTRLFFFFHLLCCALSQLSL